MPSTFTAKQGLYKNGVRLPVRGASLFGAEDSNLMVDTLYSNEVSTEDIIKKAAALGFNFIRFPFCPQALSSTMKVGWINPNVNASFAGLNALDVTKATINMLGRYGFHVLLDFHHTENTKGVITRAHFTMPDEEQAGLPPFTEAQWIKTLELAATIFKDHDFVVGIDVKNEPHGVSYMPGASWGRGLPTDWNIAVEKAGRAVLAIAPNWTIWVEGIQDNAIINPAKQISESLASTEGWNDWGGNLQPQKTIPINLPKDKIVFCPHWYGPDVRRGDPRFDAADFPKNCEAQAELNFGYLVDLGFTVIVGEFGGRYGTGFSGVKDKLWQDASVDYFIRKGIEVIYWGLNPNSQDTGGIFTEEWKDVRLDKVANLKRLWASVKIEAPVAPAPAPAPAVVAAPAPAPAPAPAVVAAPAPAPAPLAPPVAPAPAAVTITDAQLDAIKPSRLLKSLLRRSLQ